MADPGAAQPRHLEALTIDECLDLLRDQVVGRLAIASTNGPLS